MSLLAGKLYDPATVVTKATSAVLAMTAFDTTNLRLSFTAPANGSVLVRMQCVATGATTYPMVLLGVLSGAAVMGKQAPKQVQGGTAVATTHLTLEALFLVTGLTAGTSYTFDAAYNVKVAVGSTNIRYGGPNDAVASSAFGGFAFEIFDTA